MIKRIVKEIVLDMYSIYNKCYFNRYIKKHEKNIIERNQFVSSIEENRILILAPHIDDDVIGCGGAIIKLLNEKKDVYVTYLTDGGKRGTIGKSYEDKVLERKEEAKLVADYLNIPRNNLNFLDGIDGNLEESDIFNELEKVIKNSKPDAIFLPIFIDTHKDHMATYHKLLEIINKSDYIFKDCTFYFYESQSPITQLYSNTTLDITKEYDKKRQHYLTINHKIVDSNLLNFLINYQQHLF